MAEVGKLKGKSANSDLPFVVRESALFLAARERLPHLYAGEGIGLASTQNEQLSVAEDFGTLSIAA